MHTTRLNSPPAVLPFPAPATNRGGGTVYPIDLRLKEMGKSRKWLAEKTEISYGYICQIARQEIFPPPNSITIRRIGRVLGVGLDYLVRPGRL